MFWNESTRRWERHPRCECNRETCICLNLPMLDAVGKPIGNHGVPGPNVGVPARAVRHRAPAVGYVGLGGLEFPDPDPMEPCDGCGDDFHAQDLILNCGEEWLCPNCYEACAEPTTSQSGGGK